VDKTFSVGEWSVVPSNRFRAVMQQGTYLIEHECARSKEINDEPWVWGNELHIPCPDCGVTCPEEVVTVWEMMK
jgi:hypothetical protein